MVSFETCDKATNICQQLGNKRYYQISKLQSKRHLEELKGTAKATADIGLAVGAGYVGFYGGIFAIVGYGTQTELSLVIGTAGFSGATLYGEKKLADATKVVNPVYSFKRAIKLRDKVILGETVTANNIQEFAAALKDALDN